MAKVVSLTVKLVATGQDQIDAAVKALKDLDTVQVKAKGSAKEMADSGSFLSSIFERITNRIVVGIPTMYALIAAYKAAAATVGLLNDAWEELDRRLNDQQGMAVAIEMYNRWTDASGKAVSASSAWNSSLQLSASFMNLFDQAAKNTTLTATNLQDAFAKLLEKGGARGVSNNMLADIEIQLAKISPTAQDFMDKMTQVTTFLRNPRFGRSDIPAWLGLTEQDVQKLKKAGGNMTDTAQQIFDRIKGIADGTELSQTFGSMFAKVGQDFKDAMAKAFSQGGSEEWMNSLRTLESELQIIAPLIGQTLVDAINILSLLLPALGVAFLAVFAVVNEGIASMYELIATFHSLEAGIYGIITVGGHFGEGMKTNMEIAELAVDVFTAKAEIARKRVEDMRDAGLKFNRDLSDPAYLDNLKKQRAEAESFARDQAFLAGTGSHPANTRPENTPVDPNIAKAQNLIKTLDALAADNTLDTRLVRLEQYSAQVEKLSGYLRQQGTYDQAINDIEAARTKIYRESADNAVKVTEGLAELADKVQTDFGKNVEDPLTVALAGIAKKAAADIKQLEALKQQLLSKETGSGYLPGDLFKFQQETQAIKDSEKYAADLAIRINAAKLALTQTGNAAPTLALVFEKAARDGDDLATSLAQVREHVLALSNDANVGVAFGVTEFMQSIQTKAQAAYAAIKAVGDAIKTGLTDAFTAALTGDTAGITAAFKNFYQSILKSVATNAVNSLMDSLRTSLGGTNSVIGKLFGGLLGGPNDGKDPQLVQANNYLMQIRDALQPGANGVAPAFGGGGDLHQIPVGRSVADQINFGGEHDTSTVDGAGPGSDTATAPGASLAGLGGALMGAASIYQQAKAGTLTPLGGAISGAAAGTAILPGWGTLIGAVVGAIAGFMTQDAQSDPTYFIGQNKNGSLAVGSGGDISGIQGPALNRQLEQKANAIRDTIQGNWIDILLKLPQALFDKVLALPILPLVFLNNDPAHDSQGYNGPGGDDSMRFITGSHSQNWLDLFFSDELPSAMLNSYVPALHLILQNFGFSTTSVDNLVQRWQTLGSAVYAEIQSFITAMAGLQGILSQDPAESYASYLSTARANGNQTFGQSEHTDAQGITNLITLLNRPDTSLASQIKLTGEINDAMTAAQNKFLAFIAKIADAITAIHDSIADQINGILYDRTLKDGKPTQQSVNFIMQQIRNDDISLQTATSPEAIQRIVADEQRLYGQLNQIDPAKYGDYVIAGLQHLETYADNALDALGQEATDAWDAMVLAVQQGMAAFVAAAATGGSGPVTPIVTPVPVNGECPPGYLLSPDGKTCHKQRPKDDPTASPESAALDQGASDFQDAVTTFGEYVTAAATTTTQVHVTVTVDGTGASTSSARAEITTNGKRNSVRQADNAVG